MDSKSIRRILRESIKRIVSERRQNMFEMAYPVSFDMEYFKTLKTFSARVRYCEKMLKRIASGSSRIVYKIDDEKVLKLAKNSKGIAQNQVEGGDYYLSTIGMMAETFDKDENYLWIEMELAKKAKVGDFKRLTGFSFDFIRIFINYIVKNHTSYGYKMNFSANEEVLKRLEYIEENPDEFNEIFSDIIDYIGNYNLSCAGDLSRISSWGIVKRDGEEVLVLVDYGLNNSVFDEYYS